MIQYSRKLFQFICLSLVLTLGFISTANAQTTLQPTKGTSGGGGMSVDNLVAGYSSNYWSKKKGTLSLFYPSPSYGDNLLGNLYNYYVFRTLTGQPPKNFPIAEAILNMLSANSLNVSSALSEGMAIFAPIGGDNILYAVNPKNNQVETKKQKKSKEQTPATIAAPLSAKSLIGPLQYDNKKKQDDATSFIKAVTGVKVPGHALLPFKGG